MGRWRVNDNSATTTDVNFNLSQYMIDTRQQRQHTAHWRTSTSTDVTAMNRNWRRADLVDDTPARERNTWELTHRSSNFPVGVFPARLITGDECSREELAAVDSSDEDVWIPRFDKHALELRVNGTTQQRSLDVTGTRTKPTTRLCTSRS